MGTCCSIVDTTLIHTELYAQSTPTTKKSLVDSPSIIDLPLKSVSVMSSHNSYIRTIQHCSESTVDGIRVALECGARCLELDIYRDKERPESVFVAHGKEELPDDLITTTKLSFEDAIVFIKENAFKNTSDPLFLALQIDVHSDSKACNSILRIIDAHISSLLYTKSVTPNTPLRELCGKIVLMCGGGTVGPLNDRIHIQWNELFRNEPSTLSITIPRITDNCLRIYPTGDIRGALSLNYDPLPFLHAGATFVAMNISTNDDHMKAYAEYFSKTSFVRAPTV
jgi:hypothetical protein